MKIAVVILCLFALTGCKTTGTASVEGECRVFTDPGFAVQGVRLQDKRWIARTQESGIRVCGWPRPTAEKGI